MKTITKAAIVAAGVALVSQGAFALQNQLIIGFSDTGHNDQTLDLGALSTLPTSGGAVTISTFTSSFMNSVDGTFGLGAGSVPNGATVGIVGGKTSSDLFVTGTSTPTPATGTVLGNAIGNLGSITYPNSGGDTSFSTQVIANSGAAMAEILGTPIVSTISGSTLSLNLYEELQGGSTQANPWTELGTFNFTFGSSPSLTYTPETSAVPEPSTYGLLAGAGLLALCLRRQFARKIA